MKFIILVLFNIVQFQMFHMLLGISVDTNKSFNDLLQCRICMDLYRYDYNYEEYLKSEKSLINLQMFMSENFNQSKLDFIDKAKLELFSRETSMKYFFNSGDDNSDLTNSNCKVKEVNNVILRKESLGLYEDCEKKLSNKCEKILSKQMGFCYVNSLNSISNSISNGNINSSSDNNINNSGSKTLENEVKLENKNENVKAIPKIYSNSNKNENVNVENMRIMPKSDIDVNALKYNDKINKADLIKLLISENKLLKEESSSLKLKDNNKNKEISNLKQISEVNSNSEENSRITYNNSNPINKLEKLSKLLNLETQKLLVKNQGKNHDQNTKENSINSLQKKFKSKQFQINNQHNSINANKQNKSYSNLLNSSMLELEIAPEIVEKNYVPFSEQDAQILKRQSELSNLRSNHNSNKNNNETKAGWSAPKPVIFDNFQDSLANQLKDISYLSR